MREELITPNTIVLRKELTEVVREYFEGIPKPMVVILVEQRALVSREELPPNQRAASIPIEQMQMQQRMTDAGWSYAEDNDFDNNKCDLLSPWEQKTETEKVEWTLLIGAIDALIDRWRYEIN